MDEPQGPRIELVHVARVRPTRYLLFLLGWLLLSFLLTTRLSVLERRPELPGLSGDKPLADYIQVQQRNLNQATDASGKTCSSQYRSILNLKPSSGTQLRCLTFHIPCALAEARGEVMIENDFLLQNQPMFLEAVLIMF